MKKTKYAFFIIICVAFVVLGVRGFAQDSEEGVRMFLSIVNLTDKRPCIKAGSCSNEPSEKELARRFAIELDDNLVERKVSRIEEPVSGFCTQLLGVVGPETTFKITYTYPDGNKVNVLSNMKAWANGEYPEIDFAPPVKFGDNDGAKNRFRIGLEVYADPDPEFIDSVRDALLGIEVLNTNEAV